MADETIGGIQIPITADFSDLGPEMDQAIAEAKTKSDQIASAITEALSDIRTDGVTTALMKLGEAASVGADGVEKLAARMDELTSSGAVASQEEALAQALQELGAQAQAAVANLESLAGAQKSAGDAAEQAGQQQKAMSDGAQALVAQQQALDQALQQAISVLGEIHDAYTQGAVSADVLAQAEKNVDEALRAASPNLEQAKNNIKETGDEAKSASEKFAEFGNAMATLAAAFAFTEGLKELGMAALEAADHVDDATKALALLTKDAEGAEETVSQLRKIASDDALSFPNLLIASQRMTAFLGSSERVPAIMRAAADAAQVMGVNVETASKAIERFAAGGDLSVKSLKQLGLTMADMAAALGTTEDKAKAAFAALDQAGKIDAVVTALGKFKGAAKEANDDALGALVRLGQSWTQVLEEIGKALDPVVKALADFARSNIVEPIRSLVEAFNKLPEPVKDFAVSLGLVAAAIVPIAAGIAGVVAAVGPLAAAFGTIAEAVGGLASVVGGALAVSLSEVLVPIAAVGAALALLHFTGLDEDIMNFVAGPLAQLKTAFGEVATDITKEFTDLQSAGGEFFDSLGGLFKDLAPIVKDLAENFSPLVLAIQAFGGAAKDAGEPMFSLKDVIRQVVDIAIPFVGALDALTLSLKGWKSIIDEIRPALQLLGGDMSTLKTATAAATDAMRLQQDMANQNARLLADQAMGLNTVAKSTDAYAAGLKTLQDQQQKLNDAVTQAKGVLDAARDAYDGTQKSQQVLNEATAAYEKAVKAANSETEASKQAHKDAAAAAKEHQQAITDLNKELDKANQALGNVADSYDDYVKALQDGGKTAVQQIKDIDAAIDALIQQQVKLKDPSAVQGIQAMIDKLKDARAELKTFADEDAWNKIALKINDFANKYPEQVKQLPAALQSVVTAAQNTATEVGAALDKVDFAGLIGKWLAATQGLDKANQTMADNFAKAGDKMHDAALKPIPIVADLKERLSGVDVTLQGLATRDPWKTSEIADYRGMVQDLNKAGITTLQQQEAQIANLQKLADEAAAINIPLGEQLQLQGQILQAQIKVAEEYGTASNDAVLALEKIRLKQEDLKLSATGYADQFVKAINDIKAGFDQLGAAMSDAIVNGKNMGDALVGVFKKIGQSILTDIINAALVPLKKELNGLIESLLPSANAALTGTQGAIDGLAGSAKNAGASMDGVGKSAQQMSTQLSNFASILGIVANVISAGAAVVGDIYLKAISEKLFNVQTSLLAIQNDTANRRADAWSQFGQTYDRLGEVMNDTHAMNDTLKQILAAGGGGGFPAEALANLSDIAHDVHDIDTRIPTMQGALETIARDIVSLGTLLYDPLDVIRQKIGQLLTAALSGNQIMGNMPDANDVADAADTVAGAIGDSSSETQQALAAQAQSIVGGVVDNARANTSQLDTRLAAVVSAAQAQYRAATNIDDQIAALRAEYAADEEAMQQALAEGNLELAEQYRIAAGQVNDAIMQAKRSTEEGFGTATQAVTSGASTMAFAATSAGTLVAAHVDASAAAIAAAVTSAAKVPVNFSPTGQGTTVNVPPAGTQGGTVSSGSNPGIPVGTQPGFGGGTEKQPTNAPTTPTGGGSGGVLNTPQGTNPTVYTPPQHAEPFSGSQTVIVPGDYVNAAQSASVQFNTTAMTQALVSADQSAVQSAVDEVANKLPTLTGGPTMPGNSETGLPTLKGGPIVSGTLPVGASGPTETTAPVQITTSEPVSVQAPGGTANAGAGTPTTGTGNSGFATQAQTPDAQTLGFYAGTLAELEDIRVQAHRIGDVTTSFRDGLVMIGKQLLTLSAKPGETVQASFDEGGPVPFDMVAQLHQGEEVLPKDVSNMLRQMMRTPSYGQLQQPAYGDSSGGGRIVQITAPVTVITRGDAREQAIQFTTHIKKMVSNAGAYTD